MIESIADFAPEGFESGVGLALRDEQGRYLFCVAGTRHHCPPGELFYAGIGGHREPGEDWLACARREAHEEVSSEIEILSAPVTWHLPQHGLAQPLELSNEPRPLALYEMVHPPGTPRAGGLYRIVVFYARLLELPRDLPEEEIQAVIALTREQVLRGPAHKPALSQLLAAGARIVSGGQRLDPHVRLYPLGTAVALSAILRHSDSAR